MTESIQIQKDSKDGESKVWKVLGKAPEAYKKLKHGDIFRIQGRDEDGEKVYRGPFKVDGEPFQEVLEHKFVREGDAVEDLSIPSKRVPDKYGDWTVNCVKASG